MGRSLALALHLMFAEGGRPAPADRPARPDGTLVWVHLSPDVGVQPMAQLCRRLLGDLRRAHLIVTSEDQRPDRDAFPKALFAEQIAARRTGPVAEALTYWKPDVLILAGTDLPPALIVAAAEEGVPMALIDMRLRVRDMFAWRLQPAMFTSLLSRFDRVLVRDHDTAERIFRVAGPGFAPVVTGPFEELTEPLPVAEAEREAMAHALGTRPVWLAAGVTESEEEAVISAHATAMRLAHRMLLILVPSDPARGAALAERTGREGWVVALRSQDHEPDPDVQVLIDDEEGEYGLWYRLAPVSFIGGTLSGGSTRSPLEAAALGSAVIAGPAAGTFARAYARLSAARAFRALRTTADLSEAVGELIAPDKAAQYAHNAWAVSSSGVEAADKVVVAITSLLEKTGAASSASISARAQ